ncbi:ROK family protein [Micromonospora sp. CPCC 206061]|uniref:ROK family protein n=1 Tax=Micromonospora sp. CPCC 206061 TaxID=3122410 RepID=UPI002FF20268
MSGVGIVVDVGGTTTRVAFHRGGHLAGAVTRFPTPSPRRDRFRGLDTLREELFDRVARHVDRMRAEAAEPVDDIGVAFGAVITTAGVVRDASVLWLSPSAGYDVVGALGARLPWARIRVLNDVAASAWHYRRLGRYALVTVSTGVAVKAFDAALPAGQRLLLDPDGLGGESGHTVVEPSLLQSVPAGLGPAAAAGDAAARAELEARGVPWCECGAVADLCSYTSGPAVIRDAAALARRAPGRFAGGLLAQLCQGDPNRITAELLARSAADADPFTAEVLRRGTRALAARLIHICADLGLCTAVVVGGFAHGVGPPWFAALRRNIAALMPSTGWYAGWTAADKERLVHVPADAEDASLAGMAAYMAERNAQSVTVVKPVGEGRLVLRHGGRPRCGREQFLLRPAFVGVCGTDLQILRGERGCEPGVPGHECVAEVVEVGADVPDLAPGDVVGINPNSPRDDDDKIGHNRPGVFAELLVLDAAVALRGQVVQLPRPAGAELVLLEPLAGVIRAQDLTAQASPGLDTLVVGGGVAGLLHMLLARHRGARTVLLATRSPQTRRRAVQLGLCQPEHVLPLDDGLAPAVRKATGGAGADVAFVAVGAGAGPAVAALVWQGLADGAAMHLFGGFPPGCRLPLAAGRELAVGSLRASAGSEIVTTPAGRKALVTGSRGGRRADFLAAAALCDLEKPHRLRLDQLVSHVVSLPALPGVAAELAGTGTVRGTPALRVVVDLRLDGEVVRPATGTLPAIGG